MKMLTIMKSGRKSLMFKLLGPYSPCLDIFGALYPVARGKAESRSQQELTE